MNPLFLIVLALSFGLQPRPLAETASIELRLAAVVAGGLGVIAFGWWLSRYTVGRLQADFGRRQRILDRYSKLRWIHSILGIGIFALTLWVADWNSIVLLRWGLANRFALDALLLVLPFLLAEAGSFACFHAVERTIRRRLAEEGARVRGHWSRAGYVNFQMRSQYGIWLGCSLTFIMLSDLVSWQWNGWSTDPDLAIVGIVLPTVTVLVLAPWIIRLVWQATPLPPGPVRQRLESLSRQLGFRYSNILVWHTSSGIANAAVTGLFPRLRYVLLSDALLEELTADELQAVFGHEVGHIKHHHLPYYGAWLIASLALILMITPSLRSLFEWSVGPTIWPWFESAYLNGAFDFAVLAAYFLLAFGFLSRRFERQADVFGSRAVSQALLLDEWESETVDVGGKTRLRKAPGDLPILPIGALIFCRALEKVASLNGADRNRWSWRHGSIAKRVEFLGRVADDPALGNRYDGSVRRLRYGFAAALGLCILLLRWYGFGEGT